MRNLFTQRDLESKLRAAAVDATERNTRVKLRDGDGLMLVVRPGGASSWVLQYTSGGGRKDLTLGPWPTLTLKGARELADLERNRLLRGVDPAEAKREMRRAHAAAAASKGDSVLQMFEDWMAIKNCSPVYAGNIRAAFIKDVLPAIGAMPPERVTRLDIIAILRAIEARESLVLLRRVRMWLRQLYEFGIDDEARPLVQMSPVPTQHLSSFMAPVHGHFPAITDAGKMPALVRAIRGYQSTIVRTGLLLCLHAFPRPSEAREADWREFDLDGARWVIPAERMKMAREHWVPLSPFVVALLRRHQGVVGNVGLVLPGQKYGKPISEATLNGALESLGYKRVQTPHGFRATARTIGEEHLKIDPRYLEKQLAHEPKDKVEAAYNRAEYWPERVAAMAAWSSWLESLT